MCAVDWAALGTWAAVVVALCFALADRWDRRQRERSEATVIAMLLATDLTTIMVRALHIKRELNPDGDAGILDAVLLMDGDERARMASLAKDFPTTTLEAVVSRLHVLPRGAAQALLELLQEIREMAMAGDALARMDGSTAERDLLPFMPHFRQHATRLTHRAKTAIDACSALASR